jgi:sulfur carrier protein
MRVVINGNVREMHPASSLADAVADLTGAPEARGIAAALDGEVVPRDAWAETRLSDGARVELVVAVQGG